MKKLLSILLVLAFTATVNAQSISIGSEYVQLGVSDINNEQSAYVQGVYTNNLFWHVHSKAGLSVGVSQYREDTFVKNGNMIKDNGTSKKVAQSYLAPSFMVGIDIPFKNFSIGAYTGYETKINSNITHIFVPVSISLRIR